MGPKKKNLLLLAVALLLLASAAGLAFRDTIFAPKDTTSAEIRAMVEDAAKNAAKNDEPPPPEPPKSNFSKRASPVGGK